MTPEIEAKWREEFESKFDASVTGRAERGFYWNEYVQSMWEGFLMGRKSVCIELPEDSVWEFEGDDCIDLFEVEKAIESQGYTVKQGVE